MDGNHKIKTFFQQVRPFDNSGGQKENKIFLLSLSLVGIVLGVITMLSGLLSWPWLVEIMQSLGFWAFLITLISCYSFSPKSAFLHVLIFLISMAIAYYLTPLVLYGDFATWSFFFWIVCSIIASIFAPLLWYAKGRGYFAAIIAALPLSVIFFEILKVIIAVATNTTHSILLGWATVLFHSIATATLLILLPQDNRQRLLSVFIAIGVAAVISIIL